MTQELFFRSASKAFRTRRLGWDLKRAPIIVVAPDDLEIAREVDQVLPRISELLPLVVAVEDLQWADEVSLALFLSLCKVSSHSRVLLLGTYRSHGAQDKSSPERTTSTP